MNSPTLGGVGIIVFTGVCTALFAWKEFGLFFAVVILIATFAAAIALSRYIQRHQGEIGDHTYRPPEE